jgi:hypothetical protein
VNRQDPNPGAIVAGVVFAGIGAAFLLARAGGTDLGMEWIWPVLLIGLGVAGLVRSRPLR